LFDTHTHNSYIHNERKYLKLSRRLYTNTQGKKVRVSVRSTS